MTTQFVPGSGNVVRPANNHDFAIELEVQAGYSDHEETTEELTVLDAEVSRLATAHSDPYYDIIVAGDTTGLELEAMDATGDLVGNRVSRVSDGTCRLQARTWLRSVQANLNMTRINGLVYDTLAGYVAGSLAGHLTSQITNLIGAKTSAAKPIFSTMDHGAANYVRNVDCWVAALDLTAVSPWNSRGINTRAGVAISPRHCIHAWHYPVAVNDTIRFVTSGNAVVTRTVTAVQLLNGVDIQVTLLDSDLPAAITPMKVLPADLFDYLPSLQSWHVPFLACNRSKHALVKENAPGFWQAAGQSAILCSMFDSLTDPFSRMAQPIVAGDSGSPIFLVINGEAVFFSHFTGVPGGPMYHLLLTEIDSAMTGLGGGYTTQTADLSAFTNYG